MTGYVSLFARRRLGALLTVCVLALALAPHAAAQALYGSITGKVSDESGAAIPGAGVIAINAGTGLEVPGVADETGAFTIRNLLPGTYNLKASLQGFKEFVQTGIPVSAGSIVRVNPRLDVGALTESVTVSSSATLLKTDKADVSVELQSKAITDLPLNQFRNYQALINLVPGATPAVFQNSQVDTPGRSLRTFVNGTNPNNNATKIDGASSVNIWLPHHAGYVAPAETIDTVNISTNSFDADQGMAGGAAISVVTKSGTNEFRGSAFGFRNQDELNATAFFDNANGIKKADLSRTIYGGTLGGPILRNRLFFFGAWERYQERRGFTQTFTVPTAKMRTGDFSEVAAAYPAFRIYDPMTGNADGSGREMFAGAQIPANRMSEAARRVLALYPLPNATADINRNGLADDYTIGRVPKTDRDNLDFKVTFNRSPAHQIWGKMSYMKGLVSELFQLGFDGGGAGDTKVYLPAVGHTWTLSPTLLLDGSFGLNYQDQMVNGPDFGQNYGLEVFGIPGTNGPDPRQGGLPFFDTGLSGIGNADSWHPLTRDEKAWSFSQALTKVTGRHEIRIGYDLNRLSLTHWQPEIGSGPRGRFNFNGNTTSALGYQPVAGWNAFSAFLLGLPQSYGKSLQFEEMTGREWQHGLYVRDRWQVNNKLTLSGGLRFEAYPLMTRAGRGIERLDLQTWEVLLGGLGNVPEDAGINVKTFYVAPRAGAAWRINEETVFRAGFGVTYNPLPWSRPMRGFYPLTIAFGDSVAGYGYVRSLDAGIPPIPLPDTSTGRVPLPRNVEMRTPNPDQVDRATLRQWNATIERRLPGDISASLAYVGTRTDGGYADTNLNWAAPGTGDAGRQYFAQAGTTNILDWSAKTRSRYHSLQMTVNRPFKNGLMLKGAYTWGKAMNEADEDGWTGLTWNIPDQQHRNYAKAGFDRTHILQMAFVYELPFLRERSDPVAFVLKDWQLNGIFSTFSGTPFTIPGNNANLLAPGAGAVNINQTGDLTRVGKPGPDEVYFDPSVFSQPSGLQWGNTGRNAFRGPSVWNLDLSLFRNIPIGRYKVEIRAQAANVLNHSRWGNPNTARNNPNFMRIFTVDASRQIQLGLRFAF